MRSLAGQIVFVSRIALVFFTLVFSASGATHSAPHSSTGNSFVQGYLKTSLPDQEIRSEASLTIHFSQKWQDNDYPTRKHSADVADFSLVFSYREESFSDNSPLHTCTRLFLRNRTLLI